MKRRNLLAAAAAALVPAFGLCASAAATSIFGIEMGSPISSMKRCSNSGTSSAVGPCYAKESKQLKGFPSAEEGQVLFPFEEIPKWIYTNRVQVLLVEGKVERIWIITRGVQNQREILQTLNGKFGKPVSLSTAPMRNGLGIQFDVINASWQTGDIGVQFSGVVEGGDKGTVTISSSKGERMKAEMLQAQHRVRAM
jgi:hypothetical protein